MRDLATFAPRWSFRRRTTAPTLKPRIPTGVPPADVLFLWDPKTEGGYTRDWAGSGQTLTPNGTITQTVRNGHPCATLASAAYYTVPTSPIPTYADGVPYTVYAVAETTDDGKTLSYLFQTTAANILGGSASLVLRAGSDGAGVVTYSNAGALAQVYAVSATPGRVYACTGEFGAAAIQAWTDGATDGPLAQANSPTGMTNCYLGGSGTATGQALNEGCVLYYVCAVSGGRDAAAEAWLTANFPIGASA